MTFLLIIFAIALVLIVAWPKKLRERPRTGDDGVPRAKVAPASTLRRAAVSGRPAARQSTTHHWASNHFDFEIVGESHYQPQIAALAKQGREILTARIIPDDGNPFDKLAVRVEIDGQTVGHLSRDDARSFRRRLGAMRLTGQATTCEAEIRGGGTAKDGRALMYGVFLAMKEFG